MQVADNWNSLRLGAGGERPHHCRTTEQGDELAPPHPHFPTSQLRTSINLITPHLCATMLVYERMARMNGGCFPKANSGRSGSGEALIGIR